MFKKWNLPTISSQRLHNPACYQDRHPSVGFNISGGRHDLSPWALPENILAERGPVDVLMDALHQSRLLVAVGADHAPMGYAFWQNVAGSALLAQMDVHPQHGRKGLGTALVTRIIDQVAQAGFPYLYLTTFSDVPWNAPFYQKIGFILLDADSQPDFIKESLRDERERGMSNRVAMRYAVLSA